MKAGTFGRGGFNVGLAALGKGGVVGPYPAPAGFRWDYVTENGQRITENGIPVLDLVRRT